MRRTSRDAHIIDVSVARTDEAARYGPDAFLKTERQRNGWGRRGAGDGETDG